MKIAVVFPFFLFYLLLFFNILVLLHNVLRFSSQHFLQYSLSLFIYLKIYFP